MRPTRRIACILVLATLAVFAPVVGHDFVAWDDDINVYENPLLRPPTLQNTLQFWRSSYQHLYIPLTYSLWAAAARFSEDGGAEIFHALNLAFHILSVLAVFSILRILVKENWPAAVGALLFAVHPVQVEPVAWVTGFKDVLCGFLSLVAIREYLARDGAGRRHYTIATPALILALLAKPTAVVVPAIVWVINFTVLRRSLKESTEGLIGWVALAMIWIVVTTQAQPEANMNFAAPVWARPLLAGDAAAFYLYKLFIPAALAPDYGRTAASVLQSGWFYFVWPIPYVAAGLIWRRREGLRWLAAAFAVFIAGILPVAGLIPFDFQRYSTVADRYLYLSMLGPALAVSLVLAIPRRRNNVWIVAGILLVCVLGIRSAFQTRLWQNTQTLFEHTLTINPNSYVSHNNIGRVQIAEGNHEAAIGHLAAALRIKPGDEIIHNNMGISLAALGRIDEAMEHYGESLRIKPDYDMAHNNLGIALARQGRLAEATAHFEAALKISPERAEIHANLGKALVEQGKIEEGKAHLAEAQRLDARGASGR